MFLSSIIFTFHRLNCKLTAVGADGSSTSVVVITYKTVYCISRSKADLTRTMKILAISVVEIKQNVLSE